MDKFSCLSLIVTIAIGCATGATDYCKIDCGANTHIACKNNGAFSASCSNAKLVTFTSTQKQKIVSLHNTYRNNVASGIVNNLKPASKMATAVYDEEMSEIAAFNVKQCKMQHDKCRNTQKCKQAGQNLFIYGTTGALNVDSLIDYGIKYWFDENRITTNADIDKYPMNTNGRVIGHFTAMVRESCKSLGCAASTFTTTDSEGRVWNNFLFACNYCTTNILNAPVYKTSTSAASGCTTGRNSALPALCSLAEPFNT